ncbi:hypothetical protein K431DRAFT_220427 [Polychaeton citri CBS 116435]|uniref:Uncharacterized protein n=1 Tax=Polychaeton citri CBS 116435 TaxID=1314669 RepID=A0A9P4URY4_9PEZI|nr:hypothetical protein K431DRAFT_220427 [Polychaeton citri CBS 116435]
MHINSLPSEILYEILLLAARANEHENEVFTYGMSQAPLPLQKARLTKYIRGPVSSNSLRWDATLPLRETCSAWHEWALSYCFEQIFERRWRGSERWAELPIGRRRYSIYEMIDNPSGFAVYRDPFGSLKHTDRLFNHIPTAANFVRRLWFNGFHVAETDRLILSVIASCWELEVLSVPWTILRRGTTDDWVDLLNNKTGHGKPLHSLEIQAVCLPKDQARELQEDESPNPLEDSRVDFSALKRLKIFGNTLHNPICDHDLEIIARTATNLECLDFTNLSTISVAGMLSLVKSSKSAIQVLEHSPRSSDGFYHPYPGHLADDEHICDLLTSLPKMRDLSISIPHMCADLFANQEVRWEGECQVRAADICGCDSKSTNYQRGVELRKIFAKARELMAVRRRYHHELSIEIFFAGCIFEPEKQLVHGDFAFAEITSNGLWPMNKQTSTKGPYGTSGVYGNKEEGNWDAVSEEEFLHAAERRWLLLQ